MPRRRTLLIIALIVVGGILGAYFGGLLGFTVDTNTVVASGNPLRHAAGRYGGTGLGDEMLSSTGYVSSFRTSGQSELIQAQGVFLPACSLVSGFWVIATQPAAHQYVVYFSDGGAWREVKRSQLYGIPAAQCGNLGHFEAYEFTLTGPHNGGIRVELWSKFITGGATSNLLILMSDQAYISDQFGTITAPTEGALYEVGQTINFQMRFAQDCSVDWYGNVDAGAGWSFILTKWDGSILVDKDLGCGSRTLQTASVSYTVKASDFGGEGKNFLTAELFTRLFQKDSRATRTIDLLSLAPAAPTVTVDDTQVVEGDQFTVTITPAAGTTGSIKYSVTVQYADGFLVDRQIDVAQNTFTFTAPKAGTITVTASVTADGRPSQPATLKVIAASRDDPTCADTNTCPGDGFDIPLWVWFLIVGILLILGGVFLPVFDIRVKLVLLAVGGVLVVIAVLSLTGAL